MKTDELLEEISKKLSVLIALQLRQGTDTTAQDNIGQLSRFGLSTAELAQILGTTAGTVAVLKSRIKRKEK